MSVANRTVILLLAGLMAASFGLAQADSERRKSFVTDYLLGPGDQVAVRVLHVEEFKDEPLPIDMRGDLNLPLIGRVPAAGFTVEQLEREVSKRMRSYVNSPIVIALVKEFRSQPVLVLGEVNKPGVYQVQGNKTLYEILSLAEGLRPDAGHTIKITRRNEEGRIPLPGRVEDPSGEFNIAEVRVKSVMEARNPIENILVKPNDVISVPRADMVYVVGSVRRAGGFVLHDKEHLTVLQALSLAEGLERVAAPQKARIIRKANEKAMRTEIAVDIKKVLEGKSEDVPLEPEDILFIPTSAAKSATSRTLEALVQMGTGVVIFRR